MSFDLTILTKKIDGLKEAYDNGNFADALAGALTEGRNLLTSRAFDENFDTKGNGFGEYVGAKKKLSQRNLEVGLFFAARSKTDQKRIKANAGIDLTSYQRKRANKGRQILKKDLQFTFGLRRDIQVHIENEKAAVLAFNNDKAAKIAEGQENQITNIRNGGKGTTKGTGVKIFGFNDSEKEKVVEQGRELITQILKPKK